MLTVFILTIISHLCWGQTEFWFDVQSATASTSATSGKLRSELLKYMRTAKLIQIKYRITDIYELFFYDQNHKCVNCILGSSGSSFKFSPNQSTASNYIYSAYIPLLNDVSDFRNLLTDDLRLIFPKKLYDICYSSAAVSFEIHNSKNSEVQEKVKFTIQKTEQYINYNGKLIRRSYYDRIKQEEIAAERRRIEQAEAAERRRIEQERQKEAAEKRRIEQERLAEIKRREEHVNAFLAKRETSVYGFSYTAQQQNQATIENAIKRMLNGYGINSDLQKFNITDDVTVDYSGKTKHNIVISGLNNPDISSKLTKAIETLSFAPTKVAELYTKNNYTVNTQGNFQFEISGEFYEKVKVKKRFQTITGLQDITYDFPVTMMPYEGNYTLNINKLTINGKTTFDNSTVLKYHDTGTASNAFLSLLVPGLGDRRVTYGKKSGLAKGILTYSFIGAGIGCKLYSNSEYKKYHAATEQSEMDKRYKNANTFNQAFYVCAGTGAIIWIWDILWVRKQGARNSKAHKAYKQSHFGFYYHPELNANGLTYTMNF
jgi:hypothetical protein